MKEKIVISFGGSVIVPDEINIHVLQKIRDVITEATKTHQFYIITGGGKTARSYQEAARAFGTTDTTIVDKIGIKVCNLNAQLLATLWKESAHTESKKELERYKENVIISGIDGPTGSSSDLMATQTAEQVGAKKIINLTNVDYAHTADPQINKQATPIKEITWKAFIPIVDVPWQPGLNTPFDAKASKLAQKNNITVIIANGNNTENLKAILENKPFKGTTITP